MNADIHTLGKLFEDVQLNNVLGDGKTFPDCTPKMSLEKIKEAFERQYSKTDFDLKEFILENFDLPEEYAADYSSDSSKSIVEHIQSLWSVLTREPSKASGSLIPLPHPYIVPGGRFREIYYWDSYFTMLGLKESGRWDSIQNMVDNFAYLIDTYGYIPNGNRTYYLGRSQPPFFSLMVSLLNEHQPGALFRYLPHLEKEYQFWMRGAELPGNENARERVVRVDKVLLNRYWDESTTPRPESYKEDVELAHRSKEDAAKLYRHLRAAAESGWDFSSRWFSDEKSFATIHTTEILPVDLNCLLYSLEKTIGDVLRQSGDQEKANRFITLAEKRQKSIQTLFWNEAKGFFFDYDFVAGEQKQILSLAAAFPLFFKVATPGQAKAVANVLQNKFLKPGGMTTTLTHSGQQWDAPNGWAPLQWIAYRGLLNYGHSELAAVLRKNWMNANEKVYQKTGKMTEKYDVWNDHAEASGGEYPNQDGFGWTNGVYLAMKSS